MYCIIRAVLPALPPSRKSILGVQIWGNLGLKVINPATASNNSVSEVQTASLEHAHALARPVGTHNATAITLVCAVAFAACISVAITNSNVTLTLTIALPSSLTFAKGQRYAQWFSRKDKDKVAQPVEVSEQKQVKISRSQLFAQPLEKSESGDAEKLKGSL